MAVVTAVATLYANKAIPGPVSGPAKPAPKPVTPLCPGCHCVLQPGEGEFCPLCSENMKQAELEALQRLEQANRYQAFLMEENREEP